MLLITKDQVEDYQNYPILLIDELTEEYIISNLLDHVDFSELDQEFGFTHNKEEKIYDLEGVVFIDGYETGTQHSPNNIFIRISLSQIHSKYKDYSINYYTEPRVFDGNYDMIKDELEKYLQHFNWEFNKIIEEIKTINEQD